MSEVGGLRFCEAGQHWTAGVCGCLDPTGVVVPKPGSGFLDDTGGGRGSQSVWLAAMSRGSYLPDSDNTNRRGVLLARVAVALGLAALAGLLLLAFAGCSQPPRAAFRADVHLADTAPVSTACGPSDGQHCGCEATPTCAR